MRISYLMLEGRKYPLTFSLKTAQLITSKYRNVTELGKMLNNPKVNISLKIDVLADVLASMMYSGCQYCNAFKSEPYPDAPIKNDKFVPLTAEQIALCIPLNEESVRPIVKAIEQCINTSKTKNIATQPKKGSKKKKKHR